MRKLYLPILVGICIAIGIIIGVFFTENTYKQSPMQLQQTILPLSKTGFIFEAHSFSIIFSPYSANFLSNDLKNNIFSLYCGKSFIVLWVSRASETKLSTSFNSSNDILEWYTANDTFVLFIALFNI